MARLWLTVNPEELAAKLVVYHAGPGATTFLAMMKITSLLVGAFFTLIVVPAYIKAEKPPVEIAGGKLFHSSSSSYSHH